MEAIIQSGGKQYKVKKGQVLSVEKIDCAVDSQVEFDVLMTVDNDKVNVGTPVLDGVKAKAKVLRQYKGPKVVSAIYKRRKGYHKKKGHRQECTEVQITEI